MDKGKKYEVYYRDDSQTRHKNLIFESNDGGLIHFFNDTNNKQEIIPVNNIIRIQGMKDEKSKTS